MVYKGKQQIMQQVSGLPWQLYLPSHLFPNTKALCTRRSGTYQATELTCFWITRGLAKGLIIYGPIQSLFLPCQDWKEMTNQKEFKSHPSGMFNGSLLGRGVILTLYLLMVTHVSGLTAELFHISQPLHNS